MQPLLPPEAPPEETREILARHRRVWSLWNWLPAFRAAAEFESLQRAALAVNLSASALSRSISLLERGLGAPLFLRSPKGLTLTVMGRQLLAATRDATRLVDEALPSTGARVLVVCALGPVLPVVLAEAVAIALPEWKVSIDAVDEAHAIEALRCGDLDFVLTHTPPADEGLTVRQLPSLKLVMAGAVKDRHQVVSLRAPGFIDRSAAFTVTTWASAERLSARLKLPVIAPRCLVEGQRRPLVPLDRELPVFAVWRRELIEGQSGPLWNLASAAGDFIAPPTPGRGRASTADAGA